jgi:hypothetical protein
MPSVWQRNIDGRFVAGLGASGLHPKKRVCYRCLPCPASQHERLHTGQSRLNMMAGAVRRTVLALAAALGQLCAAASAQSSAEFRSELVIPGDATDLSGLGAGANTERFGG